MATRSGFFNSINGDRKYNAEFFAEYFATLIANGIFPNPSTNLQVIADDGMKIIIKAGKAWINGYIFINDDNYYITLDTADGVLKRIDRIVLRLDYTNRQITPAVKKGTFASNPVAPTLQRNEEAYEIALADVLINNGAINITQANITDQRFNTSLCGVVKGLVDQIDTTDLFNQFKDAFNTWFDHIKGQLSTDVAGNLQNQIDDFISRGFGADVVRLDNVNLDEVIETGNYYIAGTSTNRPVNQVGYLKVEKAPATSNLCQFFTTNSNATYSRTLVGGSWFAWKRLATEDDIRTGRVSITPLGADVPTSELVIFNRPLPTTPRVSVTAISTVPNYISVSAGTISATEFTIWLTRATTITTSVEYIAVAY